MSRARDLADGTFSGAFSADSPTLVVDDANNRVGAGIASPSAPLHVAADSSTLSLRISGRSSDDRSDVEFYENDNTTKLTGFTNEPGYSLWSYGTRSIYTDSDAHIFRNGSATTLARLDSDGLKFNGDTAAANALDDYEEGTFTPNWRTAGSTSNASSGFYTKVGNLVYININFSVSSTSSLTNAQIGQVPFTPSQYGTLSVFPITGFESINDMMCAQLNTSGYVELYKSTASSGNNYADINAGNINEGGSISIRIGGCYHTNS